MGKAQKDEELTLEGVFGLLDQTLSDLERSDITLEESFKRYQQGMELLKMCNEKIDTVEKKMLILNDNGGTDEF